MNHVLNHDLELELEDDQVTAAGQIGVQWPQPGGQSQTTSMGTVMWSNEPSFKAVWSTQMNQVPPNGLFNITTNSTTATSVWPLSGTTESTMDLSYSDQCPIELQMSMDGEINMVGGMPIMPQIDGTTEGVWAPSGQQFVHCDNNGWGAAANGSWDPYLYVSSVLN